VTRAICPEEWRACFRRLNTSSRLRRNTVVSAAFGGNTQLFVRIRGTEQRGGAAKRAADFAAALC